MPLMTASMLAFTMSSCTPVAVIVLVPLRMFTTTSTTASVPPVMAFTLYCSRVMVSVSFMASFTAFMAASTGPTPVASPFTVLLFTRKQTLAWASLLSLPSKVIFWSVIGLMPSRFMTFSAMANTSASRMVFPLSPNSLMRWKILVNCSLVGCMPMLSRSAFMACEPECLPCARCRVRPTSSGGKGSYVRGFASMPWVWMPDSCLKAFSPTMALFGWV